MQSAALLTHDLYEACCEGVDAALNGDLFLKQSKSALLASMNTLISKHFLTPNVWTLRMIYKSFKSIEKGGGGSEGILGWWNVLVQLTYRSGGGAAEEALQRFLGGLVGGVEGMKAAVEHVAFVSTMDFEDVVAYKSMVTERVYAYLNYVYKSVLTTENPALCLQVVMYLCSLPAKEVFAGSAGASVSIEDVIWKLLSYVAATCGNEDIKDFYLIARELYYYKLKVKERAARRNYLLFAVMTLARKDVRNKPVTGVKVPVAKKEEGGGDAGSKATKSKAKKAGGEDEEMGAWFMKPLMQDDALIAAVQRECEMRRQYHVGKEKSVEVDELPSVAYRNMVEIIKVR